MELKKLGNAKWEIPKGTDPRMRVPVQVYGRKELVEMMKRDRTFKQAINVSALPGILNASMVMPDGHEGYGFPIGGVAAFDSEEGVVSPGGVGYDINCGVRLITTNLTYKEVKPKMQDIMNALFKNIPSGVGSKGKVRLTDSELEDALVHGVNWAVEKGFGWKEDLERMEENGCIAGADPSKVSNKAMKRGRPQLGTLGSGNHFIEVQRVGKIMDAEVAKKFGITSENQVCVMVHTGSRGFGHQVCHDSLGMMLEAARKYGIELPDPQLACAPLKSKEAEKYLGGMRCAINYAFVNRHMIMHWTRESFEQVFGKSAQELSMNLVYDVCHNIAKFERHSVNGEDRNVCVHRKGATRAFAAGRKELPGIYREIGQPVIIPGSMGTSSFILVGEEKGMQETWGSTCHGAGRTMSRKQAIRTFPGKQVKEKLDEKGVVFRATGREIISEEAPGAYKDVDNVVQSVQDAGISRIVAQVMPIGVAKG